MMKHATVSLTCPLLDGERIDVDAKLAPLIAELWRLEIMTRQCCEEARPGLAEIEFPGTGEAEAFLNLAGRDYWPHLETWDESRESGGMRMRLVVYFPTADAGELARTFADVRRDEAGELALGRERADKAAP